jgi:hypothetical protein
MEVILMEGRGPDGISLRRRAGDPWCSQILHLIIIFLPAQDPRGGGSEDQDK